LAAFLAFSGCSNPKLPPASSYSVPAIPMPEQPTAIPPAPEVTPSAVSSSTNPNNGGAQRDNLAIIHGYGWLTSKGATSDEYQLNTTGIYDPNHVDGFIGYSPNGQFPINDSCYLDNVIVTPSGKLAISVDGMNYNDELSFTTPESVFGNGGYAPGLCSNY